MRRLKEIALELLDKYKDSEVGCISEGISIFYDINELEDECKWYREEIEAAGELIRCKKCKMWKEDYDDDSRGYCYLEYGSPRTTDASDYCPWWEKKERSDHE